MVFLYQCYKEGSGKKTITVQGRYYEMELRMIGYGKKPCVGYPKEVSTGMKQSTGRKHLTGFAR